MASGKPRVRAPGPPPGNSIPKGSNHAGSSSGSALERDAKDEQLFWSGGKPPRISDKSESLLDEELDMNDMDALMSPPSVMPRSRDPMTPGEVANESADKSAVSETNIDYESDEASGSESGEPTIVVSKLRLDPASVPIPPSRPPSQLDRQDSQNSAIDPQTPVHAGKIAGAAPSSSKTKAQRVRINAEVERVCVSNPLRSLIIR